MDIEIIDLKREQPKIEAWRSLVLEFFESTTDRLSLNYKGYRPWEDPSMRAFHLQLYQGQPLNCAGIQERSSFPSHVLRINSRHFIFPQFRAQAVGKNSLGTADGYIYFSGLLSRYQLLESRNMGARGAFISRDRGPRTLNHYVRTRINPLLKSEGIEMELIEDRKFNVWLPSEQASWQYVAMASFSSASPGEVAYEMPNCGVES